MNPYNSETPIDLRAIELEARKLRAQAMRESVSRLSRWAAAPFKTVTRSI